MCASQVIEFTFSRKNTVIADNISLMMHLLSSVVVRMMKPIAKKYAFNNKTTHAQVCKLLVDTICSSDAATFSRRAIIKFCLSLILVPVTMKEFTTEADQIVAIFLR